jgi:hypothetical protein
MAAALGLAAGRMAGRAALAAVCVARESPGDLARQMPKVDEVPCCWPSTGASSGTPVASELSVTFMRSLDGDMILWDQLFQPSGPRWATLPSRSRRSGRRRKARRTLSSGTGALRASVGWPIMKV